MGEVEPRQRAEGRNPITALMDHLAQVMADMPEEAQGPVRNAQADALSQQGDEAQACGIDENMSYTPFGGDGVGGQRGDNAEGQLCVGPQIGSEANADGLHPMAQQGVAPQGAVELEQIPYEKRSEVLETMLRNQGEYAAADAIKACREEGAQACDRIILADNAFELYELSQDKDRAYLAFAPGSLGLIDQVSLLPAPVVIPLGVMAVVASAWSQSIDYAGFEAELQAHGYIVIPQPLSVCITNCHMSPDLMPSAPDLQMPEGPLMKPSEIPAPGPLGMPKPLSDEEAKEVYRYLRTTTSSTDDDYWKDYERQQQEEPEDIYGDVQPDPDAQAKCFEYNPHALHCDPERIGLEDEAKNTLLREGVDPSRLGECTQDTSFGPQRIDACDGAPGEIWHCDVQGYPRPVSVFGCVCCDEAGQTELEWKGGHISQGPGGTGRRNRSRSRR